LALACAARLAFLAVLFATLPADFVERLAKREPLTTPLPVALDTLPIPLAPFLAP